MMSRGQLENLICNKMVKFQQEQLGRGAEAAKAYILDDMVIVRLKGVLTPAERQLAKTEHGKHLIKELRRQLEQLLRPELEALIQETTGAVVLSIHNDISTKTGERIDAFILDCNLEARLDGGACPPPDGKDGSGDNKDFRKQGVNNDWCRRA